MYYSERAQEDARSQRDGRSGKGFTAEFKRAASAYDAADETGSAADKDRKTAGAFDPSGETVSAADKDRRAGAVYEPSGAASPVFETAQTAGAGDQSPFSKIYGRDAYRASGAAARAKARYVPLDTTAISDQMKRISEMEFSGQKRAFETAVGKIKTDVIGRARSIGDVSDGGYWSTDETADRILESAYTLAKGSTVKLARLKKAFEEGFTGAERKGLPELSYETYDMAERFFDNLLK